MNKRALRIVNYILIILPIIINVVTFFYLPERIPAHYGFSGQVDRWGSKYEAFLLPAMVSTFGVFMLLMAKVSAKMDRNIPEWERKGRDNEKYCLLSSVAILIFFNIMNIYFLYASFTQIQNLSEVSLDLSSALFALVGILFIILGAIMPKVRRNSIFGLRTKWSMKNDETWKKSQQFGGVTFIAAGLLIIAAAVFLRGVHCMLWSLSVCTIMLIADVIYSYRASKKETS